MGMLSPTDDFQLELSNLKETPEWPKATERAAKRFNSEGPRFPHPTIGRVIFEGRKGDLLRENGDLVYWIMDDEVGIRCGKKTMIEIVCTR